MAELKKKISSKGSSSKYGLYEAEISPSKLKGVQHYQHQTNGKFLLPTVLNSIYTLNIKNTLLTE